MVVGSDKVAVPTLDLAEGRILSPPPDWSDRLSVAVAEAIGPVPSPGLDPTLAGPTFGRLLRNVLVWNEAHIALLQGRLAYGQPSPDASEEAAMEMTAAALRSLPGGEFRVISSSLSHYLEAIRAEPSSAKGPPSAEMWERRTSTTEPAWNRLRAQLHTLAGALSDSSRSLSQVYAEEVQTRWERSLRKRAPVPRKGRVRSIPLAGAAISGIGSDAQGGLYILRGGTLEAVTPDGGIVTLYAGVRGRFRPERLAAGDGGLFFIAGEKEALILRLHEKSVRWLSPAPWKLEGTPQAIAVGPGGGFYAAVGSEVLEMDPEGEVTHRHRAAGPIGGLGFQGESLVVSLPGAHRIDRLSDGGFEPLLREADPGFVDGPSPRLRAPRGIVATGEGVLAVADSLNHAIRLVLPDGSVRTLAGGGAGRGDGPARDALFYMPFALAPLPGDILAVAEKGRQGVRLLGIEGEPVLVDPPGAAGIRPRKEVYGHIDRGRALARKGKHPEAISAFDLAVDGSAVDPNLYEALLRRAAAHSALENWEGAAGDFRRAAGLSRLDIEARMGEVGALAELDQLDEAARVLEEIGDVFRGRDASATHRDPLFVRFHCLRARTYIRAGAAGRALEAADEAVRAKERAASLYRVDFVPRDAEIYVVRCQILLSLDQGERAVADSERAVEIDPGLAEGHASRGDALAAVGKLHEAAVAYREAIRLREETGAAHIGLARLYCKQLDDPDKAVHHLDRYLDLGGDERTAAEILSDLTATAQDRRGSYAEAIKVDPNGERYRLRIYEDGSRVRIPYPWE